MSHMMLELSTAHLSSRTLDALSELPADLEFCIQFAEQRGADWIMFDNDAEAVAALPLYH